MSQKLQKHLLKKFIILFATFLLAVTAKGVTQPFVPANDSLLSGVEGSTGGAHNTDADLPTVAFSSAEFSGSEGATVHLILKLVEANDVAVNIKVSFLGSSSTADAADFEGGYATQTVSFSSSAHSGTEKSVDITLKDDGNFEGSEQALFRLQNETAGRIIEPDVATLTIKDNDAPDVVINEFLADPPDAISGDANGDGNRSGNDDEFVEIVNNESTAIDISGWHLSYDGGISNGYTFPLGTVLAPSHAIVIFGGGTPTGNFGGSLIQTSSNLNLKNSGGKLTLVDDNGNIIQNVSYGSEAGNGESLTRDPDITGDFVIHSHASGAGGSIYSPGTKVDDSPFGSKHAMGIRGTEGWRMIASPVQGATLEDFFGKFRMQGIEGSDRSSGRSTIYSWTESNGAFEKPAQTSGAEGTMKPGKGYIVYFFEDDENNIPGVQGGFPKVLETDKSENSGTVNVSVSATDADGTGSIDGNEGWNLLGNPFDADISVEEVLKALEAVNPNIQENVMVWDQSAGMGNGAFRSLTRGDLIAPFQAFFVHFDTPTSSNVQFNKNVLEAKQRKGFYKQFNESAVTFNIELHSEKYYDTYSVEFRDNVSTELSKYDAFKLFSLNPNSVNIYSVFQGDKLQRKVLSKDLESTFEIPLSFDANGRTSLTFKWNNLDNIPKDWKVILVDKDMNRQVDLRTSNEYRFNIAEPQEQLKEPDPSVNSDGLLSLPPAKTENTDSRFVLSIQPKPDSNSETDLPESVKLNPNYPNPFNPSTKISFEIAKKSKVTLTIWNMIGQKVATLVDEVVDAGTYEQTWNASSMPSGIYIARFQVGGEVFTRKMTLIK